MLSINNLQTSRYFITESYNVVRFDISLGLGLPLKKMAATYEKLISAHIARLTSHSSPASLEQVIRNHKTALRGFLKTIQKSETSPVGVELMDDFESNLKLHLTQQSISSRSAADRRSLLNAWKLTFELLGEAPDTVPRGRERRKANASNISMTKFEAGLKEALKVSRLSAKTAAKRAGISTSAMGRWARGALPNIRSENSLDKLDNVLALPGGTLLKLLRETQSFLSPACTNAFRERCEDRSKIPYILKDTYLSSAFRLQWKEYFDYKVAIRPKGLARRTNGRWSIVEANLTSCRPSPFNTSGSKICESANIVWGHVSSYLGFLSLAENSGGCGLELDKVYNLGDEIKTDTLPDFVLKTVDIFRF